MSTLNKRLRLHFLYLFTFTFTFFSRVPRSSRTVCHGTGPSDIGVDRRKADEKPSYACVNIGVDRRRGDEELPTLGKVYKVGIGNQFYSISVYLAIL